MKIEEFENRIICGDAIEILKTIPDNSIDCIITSPPYFNLRNYNVVGQIGLEKTWQDYIGKLISVFDEAKRILKKEGTCFVNLGDSYGGSSSLCKTSRQGFNNDKIGNLKKEFQQKCLMMIPERFAIAMIGQNWVLRNKLVWIKKNAMPESVQDRWKKAHEYIFFFVKNKKYYFNLNAIRTPHKDISIKWAEYEQGRNVLGQNPSSIGEKYNRNKKNKDGTEKYYSMPARQVKLNPLGAVPPDFLDINTNCKQDETMEHYATYPLDLIYPLIKAGCPEYGIVLDFFSGSGTTCIAACNLNRKYIGIDLNPAYCAIAEKRIKALGIKLF